MNKNVIFKEKILQDLAETGSNIFESLGSKIKMTEKQLKYFTIAHKVNNLGKIYLLLKIYKRLLLFLADRLYRTVAHLQRKFQSFWIVILKVLCKKAGPI